MDYTSIKVGQLPTDEISGGNFIPHEVAGILKKATFTDLAAFIGANDAVGFRAVSVQNGGTLPTTSTQEFILVGAGTYNNVGGGSQITVTEQLNALVSNGTYWFIGVEIPIEAPPGNAIWGQIIGTLSQQTDLQNLFNLKADLVDGKVPSSQLPSYVDDVIEVANYAALPVSGETSKIYVTIDDNKIFRWSGSIYIEIAENNAVWGAITGTLGNQTDLQNALDSKEDEIAAGTTSQYLRGDKSWQTLNKAAVGLSNVDNTSDLNKPISTATQTALNGKFNNPIGDTTQYIAGDGSLISFPIAGQAGTLVREVRNSSGETITKGTVVYINGASGNKPTIAKALATGDSTSAQTFGIVQSDISNNANGYVVCIGDLIGVNTSGISVGTQLYLSSITAGEYTTTKQVAPAHLVYVGVVTRSHSTLGQIEVKIQNGYELDEIHDVAISSVANNQVLVYESASGLWKNKSLGTIIGGTSSQFLKADGSLDSSVYALNNSVVKLTTDQSISGKKSFNLVQSGYNLSLITSDIYNDGFIESNNGMLRLVNNTTGNDLFRLESDGSLYGKSFIKSGGTSSQFLKADGSVDSSTYATTSQLHNAVTIGTANGLSLSTQALSLGLASTSANGALSSTDWNTFNGKQSALSGSGIVKSTGGTISYLTDNSSNWDSAYNDKINSAEVTGTSTKTLTLTQQDGGTLTASWTDINSDVVTSVFGRTGDIVATNGDYTTTQVTEGTNLYYTEARVNANTNVAANTAARHAAVTIGTANGLSLSTQAISLGLASTSANGALSSTDWNTFNGKQAALSGTGFVKISGSTISYDNSTYLTSISSSDVTTALGFTPYNATNPSGYITTAGRAFPKRANGTNINFNIENGIVSTDNVSTILGTTDNINFQVYSTTNLSIGGNAATATTATTASNLNGSINLATSGISAMKVNDTRYWVTDPNAPGNYFQALTMGNGSDFTQIGVNSSQVMSFRFNGTGNTWNTVLSSNNYSGYSDFGNNNVYGAAFYDANNTGYYLNPASTSSIVGLQVYGTLNVYGSNAQFWTAIGGGYQRVDARDDSTGARMHWYGVLNNGSTSNFRHSWYDGTDYFGVTAESAFVNFTRSGGGNITTDGSFRAPIFYDLNNTAYYLDPSSTSYSSYNAGGARFRNIEISNSTYTDTIQNVSSGGNIWINYGHNGNVGLAYGGGYTTAYQSIRTPILYDTDNTGYYLDPSGTSYINSLQTPSFISAGTYVDCTNISGGAFRIYNGSTLRGGLGTDSWANGGGSLSSDINLYSSGNTYFNTNGVRNGKLDTSGNFIVSGDVTAYGSPSDIRLKTIKEKIPNALDSILKLNGYRFDWKNPDEILNIKEDIGVIAQEVEAVFPELARTNENGLMSVRHQGLTAVLIEAIKEQQTQIEELKQLVNQLINK